MSAPVRGPERAHRRRSPPAPFAVRVAGSAPRLDEGTCGRAGTRSQRGRRRLLPPRTDHLGRREQRVRVAKRRSSSSAEGSRVGRRRAPERFPVGTRCSSGSGSTCSVAGILRGAAGAAEAVRRIRVHEIGLREISGSVELVIVGRRDVDDPAPRAPSDESRHGRTRLFGAGYGELSVRKHEVDLRVDVPEDAPSGHARAAGSDEADDRSSTSRDRR